jgi:GNAT superfamily N-acetyltransferase
VCRKFVVQPTFAGRYDPAVNEIRPAVSGDAAACRSLVRAAYQHYVPRMGREPQPMSDDFEALIAGGGVWVADDDADVVAVLVLETAPDHLLVENLAVAPDRQGTDLGSGLLVFAEEQGRTRGLPEVRLYTNEAMTENLSYYVRRGFVETHRSGDSGYRRVFFTKQEPCSSQSGDRLTRSGSARAVHERGGG